ncbi:MAG: phospholipid carrier-dependent glycosyltransferase [Bdellovibrionota bacterium]
MDLKKKLLISCLCIFFIAEVLFLVNIKTPTHHNFDEAHYVPAAKQFLELAEIKNLEHPPLGKLLIASGIAVYGDNPLGWRIMSTLFGALTLVGMFLIAFVLFQKLNIALWVAGLTLMNQLLYVQSRIAMIDIFMFFFLSITILAFSVIWLIDLNKKNRQYAFSIMGGSLGLASACKWFGLVCLVAIIALFIFIKIFNKIMKPKKSVNLGMSAMPLRAGLFWLIATFLVTYFITFSPFFFAHTVQGEVNGISDLINLQIVMWKGQQAVGASHPYTSHWWQWPFMVRPIWYTFDRDILSDKMVSGVIFLGNPLIMWSGVLAILICIRSWFKTRSSISFIILFFYGLFFASWIFIPRKISFYYYYYPAAMILSLALAQAFELIESDLLKKNRWLKWIFLLSSAIIFFYFLPVLGGFKISMSEYIKKMWLNSWI